MEHNAVGVALFLILSLVKRKSGAKDVCRIDEPHRGSVFDSPGVASVASYPGLIRSVGHNAVGVALF